ncbi:phosphonate C-P lyase system protein PhnL [Samsonia erythrinae]|uniref:Alpha-D-ribose 1-methylphosphonate 5-triphosphate synthase subunit PhnL n=1 Tax=Samsonia erythrinae TaxID=160434 RepID=A0A4R3VTI3_9GAMM|nr:phosphonate C-P lyase system protein PhnL [Samsonia erythrinae]TCV08607.1 alpha-D-ribose 1-methylphosphonate 5-triphosphate synthase subunit PhnL [Samsonia erythrinae]
MYQVTPAIQINVENLSKTFVLHNQDGARLPVLSNINLNAKKGECVALHGQSGCGKSTLLRTLYANYQADSGSIWVTHHQTPINIVTAPARTIFAIRRETLGWVSQFLHVIPRISTLDIVMQPLIEQGIERKESAERARQLLARLRIPKRLWSLAPSTFSGGEQQRINIARGFISHYPILLLDEPTASLDDKNRQTVAELILEAKQRDTAIIGIFHDREIREKVSDRLFTLQENVSEKG